MMRYRCYLFILAVIFSGFLGGAFYSYLSQNIVFANTRNNNYNPDSITIVDKNGKQRIFMGLDENDNPIIALKDVSGDIRAYIALASSSPIISLRDKNGTGRLIANVTQDGDPSIALLDDKKQIRLAAMLSNYGPYLSFFDDALKARVAIKMDKEQGPVIALSHRDGQFGAGLRIDDGSPRINMVGKNSKSSLLLNVEKTGEPTARFTGVSGATQLVMAVRDNNEPGVWLFDRGKIVRAGLSYADETGPRLGMRFLGRKPGLEMGLDAKLGPHLAMKSEDGDYLTYLGIPAGSTPNLGFFQGTQPIWSPAQSGANLPGAELPPSDDILRELTR